MEVQKSIPARKKGFARYIWEFLILFLAVALGFFVESLRKQNAEQKKERQMIKAFIIDLKNDVSDIDKNIRLRNARFSQLDSIIILLRDKKIFGHENDLYFFGKMATRGVLFIPNERTIKQLSHTDGLSVIRKPEAADTILSYQESIEALNREQAQESEKTKLIYPFLAKIFDPIEFDKMTTADGGITRPVSNPFLRNADAEVLSDFSFYVQDYKAGIKNTIGILRKLQIKAKRVIEFLEREYKL